MITEDKIVPYAVSMPGPGPWLVFAPHADDETFGMGGTLLRARVEGIAVQLVIMTDGALGGSQADLAEIRQAEVRSAAALLGIGQLTFLAEPDRGLVPTSELIARIAALMLESKAATVFFPGSFEPHPDHRSTARIVWEALSVVPAQQRPRAVAYEISVQNPVNCLVDITQHMEGKQAVMNQYCSQLAENNYPEIVRAMNKLRTFSLPPQVEFAEGFYCFSADEQQCSLQVLMQKRVELLFE